jgi:uncharacterized protein (TIGR02246 family)
MRLKSWIITVPILVFVSSSAFSQQGRRPPDEKTIRDADALWTHATETKDLDQAVSFYADDASVLPFNAPIVTGKVNIRQVFSQLMSMPGFSLHFAPSSIEVAHSGDMAYEIGTFELTVNDAQGKPVKTPGKYVVVWKQMDGKWKAAADTSTPTSRRVKKNSFAEKDSGHAPAGIFTIFFWMAYVTNCALL